VVDEAQNLSPMALRVVSRRARRRSLTILGDLAQRTDDSGLGGWGEVLRTAGVPHVPHGDSDHVAAAAAAASLLPLAAGRTELAAAAAVVVAWALLEHAAPILLRVDRAVGKPWGALAVVALVAALAVAFVRRSVLPALPLLAFATVRFDEHTKWALALAVLVLLGLLFLPSRGRGPARSRPPVRASTP
jgi:hypothetical protein